MFAENRFVGHRQCAGRADVVPFYKLTPFFTGEHETYDVVTLPGESAHVLKVFDAQGAANPMAIYFITGAVALRLPFLKGLVEVRALNAQGVLEEQVKAIYAALEASQTPPTESTLEPRRVQVRVTESLANYIEDMGREKQWFETELKKVLEGPAQQA